MKAKRKGSIRRISRCFGCGGLLRSLLGHKVYYSGKLEENGREITVEDEEVLLCDDCFVAVKYYLKRVEKKAGAKHDTDKDDAELLPLLQRPESNGGTGL